jgi:hypothetical protein
MVRFWGRRKSAEKVATPVFGSPEEIEILQFENMEREQVEMTLRFRVVELQERLNRKTIMMEQISEIEKMCEQRYREWEEVEILKQGYFRSLAEVQNSDYDLLENRIRELHENQVRINFNFVKQNNEMREVENRIRKLEENQV